MKHAEQKFRIKSATGVESVVVMLIAVIVVGNLLRRTYASDGDLLFYIFALVLLYCIWMLILALVKVVKKPTELLLGRTSITVNGRTLEASELDEILINGLARRLIGIRPKGRRIVPMKLGFKFAEDEDEAMKELAHWAKMNKVPMVEKKFFKWV
ncbi:hypothetical protein [Paenibacillus caui]|uniref:hypothetical protein n=1 Tax=Paenibacillus caui TaxID=2873927 RepID=UPI001CA9427A|nr:hypothetical protein [Paenibacillus caui]